MLADGELASRCASGDEDAWTLLVERYKKKVWNVAYQFTGRADEAEELAQDIFVHLLHALRRFDGSGSLPAWIQRVSRNYAIDHYRRTKHERAMMYQAEEPDNVMRQAPDGDVNRDPYRALEKKDVAAWLRQVIHRLPDELGQAVILRDLQGMSYDEMAETLGVPLGTIKSRINRGRIELARRLKSRRREWSPERSAEGGAS